MSGNVLCIVESSGSRTESLRAWAAYARYRGWRAAAYVQQGRTWAAHAWPWSA